MQPSSIRRRSSSNPVRKSTVEREDKNFPRNDQRRTSKPKGISTGETSHIPRARFRSFSSDRAGSLGRKSCLKMTGRTPLQQPTTPIRTPVRLSTKLSVPSAAFTSSCNRLHTPLSTERSPSGDRGSSVGIKGPRKDTRPLADKAYQMAMLNKIDSFFYVNQCSTMLNSNGSLKPLTLKMFMEVSSFLLKYLDVKHDLTMTNYTDELPKCAKKLHYPGMMTKSWLKTANTMHSWPHALGWISWLVEACQVKELAIKRYQLETLPYVGTQHQEAGFNMEFQTLLECYRAWNDEKLDDEAEILEQYLKNVVIQQGITENDLVQAHKELEEKEIELQMQEKESIEYDKKIEQLQQKLALLQAKEFTKLNHLKATEDNINKLCSETQQLNTECKALNKQIQKGNIQYKELHSIVKNQPMSKAEKESIVKECMEIQNYIHQFDEHLNEYQKEAYTLDIKLANLNSSLSKAILAHNKKVFMDSDNDVGLNFAELKLPEKEFLNLQVTAIMEEKVSLIKIFKETLTKQCAEIDSCIRSEIMKKKKVQKEIESLPSKDKLQKEISVINKIKADLKTEKASYKKMLETVRIEIKEMCDAMTDLQAKDLEIEEAQDKLDAVIRRHTFLEQRAKQFFEELYKVIGEHRRELHNILVKDRTK
ncbi:PREDICTED: kinetochore protein NDC80 homolog isoform X1 [Vollenhovia emeryi]|uniref:kinetochore protein NDC80 homolog isoform X1 n=1 Tax=Vollenhovia emeryi TaxID=411798 RepID=UPI0005F3B4C4|nr:PREDICTED: kinetochore protein NDC80 homolog isoform X1 [Vollenhovia emeryi]